jgi:hypothetical protein
VTEKDHLERDLQLLETELRKLEAEYNMYFAGQLPTPPNESRAGVDRLVRRYDRAPFDTYARRFRFGTLRARYSTLTTLWERALRAREEGRTGPFSPPQNSHRAEEPAPGDCVLHVAVVGDPVNEIDKIRSLHNRLSEARTRVGLEQVPFEQFLRVVEQYLQRIHTGGSPEAVFRVAFQGGRVSLTARALLKTGGGSG